MITEFYGGVDAAESTNAAKGCGCQCNCSEEADNSNMLGTYEMTRICGILWITIVPIA